MTNGYGCHLAAHPSTPRPAVAKVPTLKTCGNLKCGKQFEVLAICRTKKYCCDKCARAAGKLRKVNNRKAEPPMSPQPYHDLCACGKNKTLRGLSCWECEPPEGKSPEFAELDRLIARGITEPRRVIVPGWQKVAQDMRQVGLI